MAGASAASCIPLAALAGPAGQQPQRWVGAEREQQPVGSRRSSKNSLLPVFSIPLASSLPGG